MNDTQAMEIFYETHPYPSRSLWQWPDPAAQALAHGGFARLLALGAWDEARGVWSRQRWLWEHPQDRGARRAAEEDVRRLGMLAPDALLLVGCGTDEPALQAMLHPGAAVTGVDLSRVSLKKAYRRLKWGVRMGRIPRKSLSNLSLQQAEFVQWVQARREGAPEWPAVQCFGVLHHQAQLEPFLQALAAVVKPGGTLRLMVYPEKGRRLERRLQRLCAGLPFWKLRLWQWGLHLPRVLRRRLGMGDRISSRFKYLGLSRAALADALCHPSDPGWSLEAVGDGLKSVGFEAVFVEGLLAGGDSAESALSPQRRAWFGPQAHGGWRELRAADARGRLLSNPVGVWKRVGSPPRSDAPAGHERF